MYYFYNSPKIPHNFHDIHYYIVNLWKFYVHSTIRYWHYAKFATRRWIKIWALKHNDRKAQLKVQYPANLVS